MRYLLSLILGCLMAVVFPGMSAPQDPRPLKVLDEWLLPEEVAIAGKFRWAGSDAFLVPANRAGLAVVKTPGPGLRAEIESLVPARELDTVSGVASSELLWAVSDLNHGLSWKKAGDPDFPRFYYYGFVMDFDLYKDKILILGARIDEKLGTISDGALAWIGSPGEALEDLKPVLFSQDPYNGVGAMGDCGYLGLGAVRFLADGSFVVAPGVEPNVNVYHPDGRLRRVLGTAELGIDSGCRHDVVDRKRVRISIKYRFDAFLNKYRQLDEILPLRDGPALVIRNFSEGMTRWRMILVRPDGSTRSIPLPFASPSPYSVLEGDVRDDRIAFLVKDVLVAGKQATPTKLIITTTPGNG